MQRKLRSDRIEGPFPRQTESWQQDVRHPRCLERGDDVITLCRRQSVRKDCHRIALELSRLTRRVAVEAPEVCDRLRQAAEALQLLGARLTLADEQAEVRR